MISAQEKLRARTKQFALDMIRLTRLLPHSTEGWVIGKQMLRSGTSVAANYRAASRGRSHAEFVSKMGIVMEEADETVFWLELLDSARIVDRSLIESVMREANELLRIFAASYRTAKASTRDERPVNKS